MVVTNTEEDVGHRSLLSALVEMSCMYCSQIYYWDWIKLNRTLMEWGAATAFF